MKREAGSSHLVDLRLGIETMGKGAIRMFRNRAPSCVDRNKVAVSRALLGSRRLGKEL